MDKKELDEMLEKAYKRADQVRVVFRWTFLVGLIGLTFGFFKLIVDTYENKEHNPDNKYFFWISIFIFCFLLVSLYRFIKNEFLKKEKYEEGKHRTPFQRFLLRLKVAWHLVVRHKHGVVIYLTHDQIINLISDSAIKGDVNISYFGMLDFQMRQTIKVVGSMIDDVEVITDKATFESRFESEDNLEE